MPLKAILLVALAAVALVAAKSADHVIAGDFTSVDSVVSRGFAAFRHPGATATGVAGDTRRYPNGQFLDAIANTDSYMKATGLRSYAQDGTIVGINGAGTIPSGSELILHHNASGEVISRLFGFNGYFGYDNGQPSGQPNPRSNNNYVGAVANIALLGAAPSRKLVVCMNNPGSFQRLLVGNSSLPNPSNTQPPTNLAPQLLLFSEGSSSNFFNTGFQVNTPINLSPTVITPTYVPPTGPSQPNAQPGVDCSSLVAGGQTVMIQTPGGPYYLTNNVGGVAPSSWTQATRDPAKAPGIPLGPGISPIAKTIYLLGAETGTPTIYWYGGNPSDATLQTNDAFNTIYKYSAGAQWNLVIPTQISRNVTFVEYVVGNGGDSEIYFTLAAVADPSTLPSPLDGIRMPVQQYVFVGGPQGINYIAPLWQLIFTSSIHLHYDINLKSLVVFGSDLGGATVGNRITYKVPEDDRRYFSKSFAFVTRYDSTTSTYVPVYGGGFDAAPGKIVSVTNGITYFEGAFNYAFQRFTGPISRFNTGDGIWDYSYGAAFERVDIDGGDNKGIFNGAAAVYDIQRMSFLGNDGYIVGGEFRTADAGTVPCNSICFFPSNNGAKLALFDSPSSAFYNNSGVRMADAAAGSAIPEHTDSVPGLVSNIVVNTDGETAIYVGGNFNIAGDKGAANFAIFTLSSKTFGTGWSNANGGVNGMIFSMVKHKGNVYIGGSFTTVGGNIQAKNVAGFNLKSRQWFSLNRGLDGTVYKLVEFNGNILAVGTFATGSGQTLGFTGIWDGSAWSPLTVDFHQPRDNCLISYCYASEIPASTGVYDAFVYGSTPYLMLASGSSLSLIVFLSESKGFVRVDGGMSRNAAPQFTSTTVLGASTYVGGGASYISTSPFGNRRLDLWNIEQAGSSNFLEAKHVSTFNLDKYNFENNAATGVNGNVFIALPEAASSASTVFASLALLFVTLFALLL